MTLRETFLEAIQVEDFTRFKFVDEMRMKHLGPAPTSPIAAATPGLKAGSAWARGCPCTRGQT